MKMIFGGIYKRKGYVSRNDQHYYFYIPVAYKNKDEVVRYRMVDTYEAQKLYGTKTMEDRIKYLEEADCGESSYGIFWGPSSYYYANYYDLPSDELDENEWELIADLHDYKPVDDREVYDYLPEEKKSNPVEVQKSKLTQVIQNLNMRLQNEINIVNRYELQIVIKTAQDIFNLLFEESK